MESEIIDPFEEFRREEYKTGLSHDLINEVGWIENAISFLKDPESWKEKTLYDLLKPMRTFDERNSIFGQRITDKNRELSNSDAILSYDSLVAEFNQKREEIIKNNDLAALEDFENRFRKLIIGE